MNHHGMDILGTVHFARVPLSNSILHQQDISGNQIHQSAVAGLAGKIARQKNEQLAARCGMKIARPTCGKPYVN